MGESAVVKLARPSGMRGALINNLKRNMVIAFFLSCGTAGTFWYTVVKNRKDTYTNFHKNFDAQAMFERQKAAGVFQYTRDIADAEEELAG